ncbi:hypothetical protein OG946_14355 [Streptomyces sp. NBC_01808]|uniref:hypothetical protein n=1 Tax=Streptomyces sp. NBC_01808 TaxID=2975947 RepID=UPI002DD94A41|nr:hypothetical protein [Streptomyces sp. NBC_01808]WSA38454.1 hypothetical protein OG946_14355 [Streptomyces sp. NBC_01808]
MLENTTRNKRYVVGSVLVLAGVVGVVWSVWRPWYNGRDGRFYGLGSVFDGISGTRAQLFGSIFLPFAFAALVAIYGTLTRSRRLVVLAALLVLFITALWMLRQSQAVGGLKVSTDGTGLDVGTANAVIGVALMLVGVGVWGKQQRHPLTPPAEEPEPESHLRSVSTTGKPGRSGRPGEPEAPEERPDDRPEEPPRAA